MTKYLWALILCVGLGLSVAACGADDDDDDTTPAGTGGTGGTAGTTSGTGGNVAGTGGTAGSMMMMGNVMCGTATCTSSAPMIPGVPIPSGFFPAPCCLNAAMNMCGVSMNGGACMMPPPPPTPHPNCPGARAGMMGCCTNGDCGQDATLFGMGCVENSRAAAMTMGLFMIPAPKKCDVPLSDAGMMMMDDDAGTN